MMLTDYLKSSYCKLLVTLKDCGAYFMVILWISLLETYLISVVSGEEEDKMIVLRWEYCVTAALLSPLPSSFNPHSWDTSIISVGAYLVNIASFYFQYFHSYRLVPNLVVEFISVFRCPERPTCEVINMQNKFVFQTMCWVINKVGKPLVSNKRHEVGRILY